MLNGVCSCVVDRTADLPQSSVDVRHLACVTSAMTMDDGENFFTGLSFDPMGAGGTTAAVAAAAATEALQAGLAGVPRSPGALNTPVSVSSDANFSFKTDFLVSVEPVPITGTPMISKIAHLSSVSV